MDQAYAEFIDRIEALERELSKLKIQVSALSVDREKTRKARDSFLELRDEVSRVWSGSPSAVEEIRKGRRLD